MKNYYEVLEITPDASEEVIKAAYKALVKRMHPDNGARIVPGAKTIEDINEAYAVLSNKERRAEYDYRMKNSEETSYMYTNYDIEKDNDKRSKKKEGLATVISTVILAIVFKIMGLPRWLIITSLCIMTVGIAELIYPYVIHLINKLPYAKKHWSADDSESLEMLLSSIGVRSVLALYDVHNIISAIATFSVVCGLILVVVKFVEILVKIDE